jgi:hypothetical protein
MSFLTKPTIIKGEPSIVGLVKSQLVSLVPKVATDTFFSDTTNWKRILIQYKNIHGQKEVLAFDASQELPTSTFSVTDKARSDYRITRIIVTDIDEGTLVITREDLSTALLGLLDVFFEPLLPFITVTATQLSRFTTNISWVFSDFVEPTGLRFYIYRDGDLISAQHEIVNSSLITYSYTDETESFQIDTSYVYTVKVIAGDPKLYGLSGVSSPLIISNI